MTSRSRKWCGTLNNYSDDDWNDMVTTECVYSVIGKEVGEKGTPHLQMFFYFEVPRSLNYMKAIHDKAHWEMARGTVEENTIYCTKGDDFEITGDPPMSQEEKGRANKRRYAEAWELAKEGRFEEIDPMIRFQHYNTMLRIHDDYLIVPPAINDLVNEWRWGVSGSGKSRPIQEGAFGAFYSKAADNKWWDDYKGEETVLIEDVDKYHVQLGYNLKIWADHYPFRAEYKGGSKMIRPKRIIVTSNWRMCEIWPNEQTLGPLLRRFKEIQYPLSAPPGGGEGGENS